MKDSSTSSSTATPSGPPPSAIEMTRKRRRDDDFDIVSFKRRAVSPGMNGSATNSPILSQSPAERQQRNEEGAGTGWWGTNAARNWREGSAGPGAYGDRSNSTGSGSTQATPVGPKRVGLQGMTDTNDGLMKMSIE